MAGAVRAAVAGQESVTTVVRPGAGIPAEFLITP